MDRKGKLILYSFFSLIIFLSGGFFIVLKNVAADSGGTITTTVSISVCGNGVKESGERCDGADFGGGSCSALGFSGGTLSCSAACDFNTANCTSTAEASGEALFTSSAGGSYILANGSAMVQIDLPKDFYSRDLRLQLFSYDESFVESSKPAPSGKSFVGKTYDFYWFNPDGGAVTAISKPATLVFTYIDADAVGLDEDTLAPYRRESGDSAWQRVSGATIDKVNHKVTFSTAAFSSFALFASQPASASGSSASGGGGSSEVSQTNVSFSGKAYPKSRVVVLKDAQIAGATAAGENGNFQASISGLSGGNYLFSVYSEDGQGRRSPALTFPINIVSGSVTDIPGLFIPPTIAVDKSEAKKRESVSIFGQSAPNAEIAVAIFPGEKPLAKVLAGKDGAYSYNFDAASLKAGRYQIKSKAELEGRVSPFSEAVNFTVGETSVSAAPAKIISKWDLDGDGRVNLVDFSIMAYWYKKSSAPPAVDFNGDGVVDLIDLSILAFYWTG